MKLKVIATQGLPASGKSTWARQFIEQRRLLGEKWKHVCRDDLRDMLDFGVWKPQYERTTVAVRNAIILAALTEGNNVVVDETLLNKQAEESLRRLLEEFVDPSHRQATVEFEIKRFDIELTDAIANDLHRGTRAVGPGVIRGYARRYLAEPPYRAPDNAPIAVMADMDGTLAFVPEGVNPKGPRNYIDDKPNTPVIELLDRYLYSKRCHLIVTSGRREEFRDVTMRWLGRYGLKPTQLYMRANDDNRHDYLVKRDIFNNNIRGRWHIDFVLDDRVQVVDEWRQLGLTCLQVADGDF